LYCSTPRVSAGGTVGAAVGTSVGAAVGATTGAFVGATAGTSVGTTAGASVVAFGAQAVNNIITSSKVNTRARFLLRMFTHPPCELILYDQTLKINGRLVEH
jgi:uncharacterized protein YcfJ